MTNKPSARTLPCVFEGFFAKYLESQLVSCKPEENQKWRHASANAVVEWIDSFAKYFPELFLLRDSLDNYSICERHYNQIVTSKSFFNKLITANDSEENNDQWKRLRTNENEDIILQQNYESLMLELSNTKNALANSES